MDPEILTKISNYEMAYRMQTSVPEVMDVSDEPQYIFDLYGEDSKTLAPCRKLPPGQKIG